MLTQPQILEIINELHVKHPELSKYGGLGYCGYGSILVQEELKKRGIESQILHGVTIRQTPSGRMAYTGVTNVNKQITETTGEYAEVRKILSKPKGTIYKNMAHIVVCINDELIIDPTSMQFLMPRFYNLTEFTKIWTNIFKVKGRVLPVEKYFFRFQLYDKVKWIEEGKLVESTAGKVEHTSKYKDFLSW